MDCCAWQDGVPETIKLLRNAGINVWMLTGDKQNTAVQIGLLCNLITPGTVLSSEIDYPVNLDMQMFCETGPIDERKNLFFCSTILSFSKIKIMS